MKHLCNCTGSFFYRYCMHCRLIAECELLSTGGKEQDRTYRSQFPRGLKQPTCSPSRLRVRRIRLAMPLPIEGGSRRDWEMPSRRKFCARLTYFVAAISLCSFASANECTPEQAADCDVSLTSFLHLSLIVSAVHLYLLRPGTSS